MGQKFVGQTSSYNSLFKPLSYCFEEIIGHDVKVSFASRPVSRLIQSDDIKKIFKKRLFISKGINFPMKHARRDDERNK